MKKYYQHGTTYFELDFDTKVLTNVTVNEYSKSMVVSEGLVGAFNSTAEALENNVLQTQVQGPPFVISTKEEFLEKKKIAVDYLLSQSLSS
jgi:hypothetical protein